MCNVCGNIPVIDSNSLIICISVVLIQTFLFKTGNHCMIIESFVDIVTHLKIINSSKWRRLFKFKINYNRNYCK